jgi:hypothetical protein
MGKKPVVSAPIVAPVLAPVLTSDQIEVACKVGAAEARTSLDRLESASQYAKALGTNPTFVQWEAMRAKWVEGYHTVKPDTSSNAGDKAFSTFARYLNELYGIDKPKSTSAAAQKKAEERKAELAKLEEKYQDQDLPQIMQQIEKQYEKLAKSPTDKHAEKKIKELKKIARVKASDEKAELAEEIKQLKEEIRSMLSAQRNVDVLREVHDCLSQYVDTEADQD